MSSKKKKDGGENIRVVIRMRNLLPYELERGDKMGTRLDLATQQVIVQHSVGDPDMFAFDAVFNNSFSQRDIFLQEVQPLVASVLQGYNATVFAYGQSGSGKTHTMTGDLSDPTQYGMMPQVVEYLFNEIKKLTTATKQFKVKVSYVELYNGNSRDLLTDKQVTLEIKQTLSKNFYVKGAEVLEVASLGQCIGHFNAGTERRRTASTDLNAHSSRSHSLFILHVDQYDYEQDPSSPSVMSSKINVVDLAGSEKLSKTNATGETMKEGCNINLSLTALATVIDKLVKNEKHIPYRGSPLTMLLKDSLGGNSKTVMFANIGPSDKNTSETISTLRFAERAKQIENKPVKNLDPKDAKIQELLDKIEELQRRLGGTGGLDAEDELARRIEQLEIENGELKESANKDTVLLQESLRQKEHQLQQMADELANREKEIHRLDSSMKMQESNFQADLMQLRHLRERVTNFIRRVVPDDTMRQIRAQIPPDVEIADERGICDVREIDYYLEGFVSAYEEWRRSVFTQADLQREVQRGREEVEHQLSGRLQELERERFELISLRDQEHRQRSSTDEMSSHLKVEMAGLKEENTKLKEKVERDQEKFKQKLEKVRTDAKQVVDELEAARAEVVNRDREIERLKRAQEDAARFGGGSSAMLGGSSPTKDGPESRQLREQFETVSAERDELNRRMREINLQLRRKGICVVSSSHDPRAPSGQDGGAGGGMPGMDGAGGMMPGAPGVTTTITLTGEDDSAVDSDLVGQMQTQLRIQHRLHELRHAQQRKLDDLIRKYELLTTGKVTPLQSSAAAGGGGVDDAQYQTLMEELKKKEATIAEITAENGKTMDKLVKKLNKRVAEFTEREQHLLDEKGLIEEERNDLRNHADDLTKFNTQLALEVENLRAQLNSFKSDADADGRMKAGEIAHLRRECDEMRSMLDSQKKKFEEHATIAEELRKAQQNMARTEAALKEKINALEQSRGTIKWANEQVEQEKLRAMDLERQLKEADLQYQRMEESWRQQLLDNANKLVQINNKRLEEQAGMYQEKLSEEQEKQKLLREKFRKVKAQSSKVAQKFDEMVLENEKLLVQLEEEKLSSMKKMLARTAEAEDTMGRGMGFGGVPSGLTRPQSAHRR